MRTTLPPTFICGLVRNAAAPLKQTLYAIKGLETICESSFVLVVTNDNVDETDAVLRQWKSSSANYDVLWLDGLERAFPQRIDRIAAARNFYLQQLLARSEAKGFALVMVMDLDGPNINLNANSVIESVSNVKFHWDGIFANQRQAYYDIYALRHHRWCPDDCWKEVARATIFPRVVSKVFRTFGLGRAAPLIFPWCDRDRQFRLAMEKFVHSRQFRIPRERPPIAVKSAFGGLALYRSDAIKGSWYASRDGSSQLTCEHVLFNGLLHERGAKLFILPSLLNDAQPEFLGPLSGAELPEALC